MFPKRSLLTENMTNTAIRRSELCNTVIFTPKNLKQDGCFCSKKDRKFCTEDYFGRDSKQNRRFARLSLSSKNQVHHTELSHFRSSLSFRQVMNLLLYFLHYFYKSRCLENSVIHGIDSSELPAEMKYPLCTVKVGRNKIRIYSDLDCDCGKRRNKRDKSHYVVGYRLHTLTAINPSTGHSFPLISLVVQQTIMTVFF